MNQPTTHFALVRPVFQPQSLVHEGQVVRNEDTAYVIRELSGRQTRVAFDRKTVRNNIAVGDTVVARFDDPPSSAYATSITRGTGKPTPPLANASPASKRSKVLSSSRTGTITRSKRIPARTCVSGWTTRPDSIGTSR
jgi:hypothetical protein